MTTRRFITNSDRWGSFWALYLMGIRSPNDIRYTLIILTLHMVCGLAVVYQTNRLILSRHDTITTHELITTIIIVCLELPINTMITAWLSTRSNYERLQISERIVNWVVHVFDRSTHEWRRENPDNVQIEAMDHVFNTYYGITWNFAEIITSSVNIMSFVVMAFFNSWLVGLVVVAGSVAVSLIRRHFNADLERANSEMGTRSKETRLMNWNRHTNRSDCAVNHAMTKLMNPKQYNPVKGLSKGIRIWDMRDDLSRFSKLIDTVTKAVLLILVCFFNLNDQKMVVWILLNGNKLFGFTNIIARIDGIKNLMGSRLAPHLKIIEALRLGESSPIVIRVDENDHIASNSSDDDENHRLLSTHPRMDIPSTSPNRLESISIPRLKWTSGPLESGPLVLSSTTPIVVDCKNPGVVIMDGKKGCGKSLLLDIFGGQYDGFVAFGAMLVNGILVGDEFRNPIFSDNRMYIQQLVSDRYRRNQKGTITMTLRELFPGATYETIYSWLLPFDMIKKMPPRSFDALDISVGKNERSFSPGELQAMVLASQLWKAALLGVQFLLLDEFERNIDFETVRNIFDKVIAPMIAKYRMTVIMVTHCEELKAMLNRTQAIKQTFRFRTEGTSMTFGASTDG